VAAATLRDALGNQAVEEAILRFTGDTQAPTLAISSDRSSLRAGETATLRFSFSEVPTGFTASDVAITGGTLGDLSFDGSGRLATAVWTPLANSNQTVSVSVAAGSYTDAVGNSGQASNTHSLSVDTVGNYTKGQAVIDLGSQYGKLINPVTVDGGRVYYYWDVSGDETLASKKGAGYANRLDYVTHDWLDQIFQQDVNGRVEGENGAPVVYLDGDTDNTYRYATLNGVKLALPTVGDGDDFIGSGELGYRRGTAIQGTAVNDTYDDYLAIWDGYNGRMTGTNIGGMPPAWVNSVYWSATPTVLGHAVVRLTGYVHEAYGIDSAFCYVAVEVL